MPYNFSLARFGIVFSIITFIYLLFNAKVFKRAYNEKDIDQKYILKILTIFFIVLCFIYAHNSGSSFNFINDSENLYERYLTDSLLEGKVALPFEATEQLKNMENPYDYTTRKTEGVSYLYDVAYYNGNYYLYFSPVPAFLLFIPCKLLTGLYMPLAFASLIFITFGSIFTVMFTKDILNKYFKNISFRWIILSVLFMLFSENNRNYGSYYVKV